MSSFVKVLQTLVGLTILWVILLASTMTFSSTETYRSSTLEKIPEKREPPAKRNIVKEIEEKTVAENKEDYQKEKIKIKEVQKDENHEEENYEEESNIKTEKDALQLRIEKNRAFCENIKYKENHDFLLFGKSSGNIGFKTCLVAKAASTTLTMASLLATGRINPSKSVTLEDVTNGDVRFNKKCINVHDGCLVKSLPQVVNISESVIFVREPMDRLYSAYKDKIARISGREFFYKRYTRYMKPKAPPSPNLAIARNFSVSFEEFVTWLISFRKFSANEHWRPQVEDCSPCGYTFIGHVETLNADLDSLFSRLHVNLTSADVLAHTESVNPHRTSKTKDAQNEKEARETIEDILLKLPKSHRNALLANYKKDYEAFGYDIPHYLL